MTEVEIAAGVMVVQGMLYMHRLLESLKLKVELPMVLKINSHALTTIILKLKFPIKNSVNDTGKDDLIWFFSSKMS